MSKKSFVPDLSRRRFIGSGCCAAVGATGLLSTLGSLRLIGAAASPRSTAAAVASDYKALVCLFLNGGNDANNMIVPTDAEAYAAYAAARSNLALPQTGLLPISPRTSDGRSWALHAAMPDIQNLFGAGKAAILANVGSLAYPTTKSQYTSATVPLPRQLYSHSDQQVQWQTSVPDKPSTTGWGGRLADLVDAFNTNNQISMSVSVAGVNTFQVGSSVTPCTVSTGGAIVFNGNGQGTSVEGVRSRAQRDLFAQAEGNLFETAFGTATTGAIASAEFLNTTLAGAPALATQFPNTSSNTASAQLRMVARLIAAAPSLGLKRQVFFVQLGGWDTHAAQVTAMTPTSGAHATLLGRVSEAVKAFYDAMIEVGASNQVTLFTASDFGRTYRSNGDGSDHGWGNHQLIVGGAVNGGDMYGQMPTLTINGPDDTGQGRWIPTTSVDEFAATLATWFGVSATDLPLVLPNIGRFAKPNLGFMV